MAAKKGNKNAQKWTTETLTQRALQVIEENALFFYQDVYAFIPCSNETFYRLIKVDSNESKQIKKALEQKIIATKAKIRTNLMSNQNPVAQITAYKMIATPEERHAINSTADKPTQEIFNKLANFELANGINPLHWKFIEQTQGERYSIMYGGRRSGKTYSRLQYLHNLCQITPELKVQVIASTLPIIKTGCLADFERLFPNLEKNSTDKIFKFKNGSTLQFMQVSDKEKANQIGRADYRFINEANFIDKETFDNLAISTERQVFIDFNPTEHFWVDEIATESNIKKFNWWQNPFLTDAQREQFLEWIEVGKKSRIGSANYYRWQVYCEGNYCELAGDLISSDNLRFSSNLPPLRMMVAFADPSNARGNDYFAISLTGIDQEGNVWLVDSLSFNDRPKVEIANKLKEWRQQWSCEILIEINGQFGSKFFKDCQQSGIPCREWWSSANKFDRIFANLDIFTNKLFVLDTPANNDFCSQFYQFSPECKEGHDDNIDCLNNNFLYYIDKKILKTLFV